MTLLHRGRLVLKFRPPFGLSCSLRLPRAGGSTIVTAGPREEVATLIYRSLSSGGNVTYSGGHAIDGQGGFYGSGGARAGPSETTTSHERHRMLALAADVQKIQQVMEELETLEHLLQKETTATSSRSIEIKANIKRLMTGPEVLESLHRLEIEGEPVWGLSTAERAMIILAREKVNEC